MIGVNRTLSGLQLNHLIDESRGEGSEEGAAQNHLEVCESAGNDRESNKHRIC